NAADNIWVVEEGSWYGWPDYSSGIPVTDPRFRPAEKPAPRFLLKEHLPVPTPFLTLPPHVGVGKVDFSPAGAPFGHAGEVFVAEVGDMAPITGQVDEPQGFQVVRIPLQGEGGQARKAETFLAAKPGALGPRHLEHALTAGPRRPVDVRFSPK